MSIFRLQNKIPQVYTDESRDFQVLCRVMDALHGGVMYDITSMQNLSRPLKINDALLRLYATKVGFFTNRDIDATVLRYILAAFPYIIKYKGTLRGVEMAALTILKAENAPKSSVDPLIFVDDYCVYVYMPFQILNRRALEEVLKYVIPTGYDCKISSRTPSNPQTMSTGPVNTVAFTRLPDQDSGLRSLASIQPRPNDRTIEDRLKGAYDTNTIVHYEQNE